VLNMDAKYRLSIVCILSEPIGHSDHALKARVHALSQRHAHARASTSQTSQSRRILDIERGTFAASEILSRRPCAWQGPPGVLSAGCGQSFSRLRAMEVCQVVYFLYCTAPIRGPYFVSARTNIRHHHHECRQVCFACTISNALRTTHCRGRLFTFRPSRRSQRRRPRCPSRPRAIAQQPETAVVGGG
jgi:hypothetical protein